MGFARVIDYANAHDGAATWRQFMYKTSTPVLTAAGMWADSSMGAGIPKYNAYVGTQGESTPMFGLGNFGVYVGPNAATGQSKHLAEWTIASAVATHNPMWAVLCDYLLHYPLVDMDSTDTQLLDNIAPLPRYASGNGVRIMAVCTTPQSVSVQVNVSYTNSAGVSGRVVSFFTAVANTGMLQGAGDVAATGNTQAPFLPLASGDTGVRQLDSVTLLGSAGGFCAFVLVKPLANNSIRELSTVHEINYLKDRPSLPKIEAGACLNPIYTVGQVAASGVLRGEFNFATG